MVTIRGAITVNNNDYDEIINNTKKLLNNIIMANNLDEKKIISVFFSCTKDLTKAYPAIAARELGLENASLMCLQEMYVEGSLKKCIRICLFYSHIIELESIHNIYLNDAKGLRPDLI